jgi:hypothetical protein
MMLRLAKFFVIFMLYPRAHSLNMTVQVTLTPEVLLFHPVCSVAFLDLFQPLLTLWVTEATTPFIADFTMQQGFVLTYYNPSRRRLLRVGGNEDDSRLLTSGPCSTCTSAGCFTYCGKAGCDFCGNSRRLAAFESKLPDNEEKKENGQRELDSFNFGALGVSVSAAVEGQVISFLLSQIVDILGCLGDPLLLTTNVTFSISP